MKSCIKEFESDFQVIIPEDLKKALFAFENYVEDFVIIFIKQGKEFYHIRDMMRNDGDIIRDVCFSDYVSHLRMGKIAIEYVNKNSNIPLFPIAINSSSFICLEFEKTVTRYIIVSFTGSVLYELGNGFSESIYKHKEFSLDRDLEIKCLRQWKLLRNDQLVPIENFRHKCHYLYLTESNEPVAERYSDVLPEYTYETFSEDFEDLPSIIKFIENINILTASDNIKLIVSDEVENENIITINPDKLLVYYGREKTESIENTLFDKLNKQVKHLTQKRFICFWDHNFGDEFGVAFINPDQFDKINKLVTLDIMNELLS